MKCSVWLYPIAFIVSIFLFFRLEKIEPYKNFYVQFPNQQECFQDLIRPFTQDDSTKIFNILPLVVNQCSYNLIRMYFKTIRVGHKSVLFLPREKEMHDVVVSHNQFIFSDDEQCLIVHVSELTPNIRLELKMKKMYPTCKVVKVSTQVKPEMDDSVEVVRRKFMMTFGKHSGQVDQKSVDLDTLIRLHLKNRYIEALYLDESISTDRLLEYSSQKDFASTFPVCQLTVTVKKPKSKNEEIRFWHFVRYFLVDSPLVLVSSRHIDHETLDVVLYNPVNGYCNFKHFSIPFNHKGIKF